MALGELGSSTPTGRKPLGNLAAEQHKKHLKSAKRTMAFVGILSMAVHGVLFFLIMTNGVALEKEVAKLHANPEMVADEGKIEEARHAISVGKIATGVFFLTGIAMLGLCFYVNTNPVAATTWALGIYIGGIVVSVALDPSSFAQGIIIKILIIALLFRGLKSAKAIEEIEREESGSNFA